ncbi:hypothetical protein GCM10009133_20830 [Cocleimonas flava]|uniref:Uncharacterized protein n=1 Tax=Cocleimonas flava TaxID=634765 RepID=A0A4R1EU45_9GAMM|nr:hypothetical protein [Cocleimonas flava]TCJ82618.1 hypothetical protein EV695_3349 [Cocleimonas flava]
MKKRTFIFDASDRAGEVLTKALHHYIEAAYPTGGSDCAAASREALIAIIAKINSSNTCEISTRQRPVLIAAVNWYFNDSGIEPQSELTRSKYEFISGLLIKKK